MAGVLNNRLRARAIPADLVRTARRTTAATFSWEPGKTVRSHGVEGVSDVNSHRGGSEP